MNDKVLKFKSFDLSGNVLDEHFSDDPTDCSNSFDYLANLNYY